MRDPEASLAIGKTQVRRELHQPLGKGHFLHTALSRRWAAQQRLMPFEVLDPMTVVSPRLAFVSQPGEWCDAQLFDAGQFTLQLQQEAVEAGFDLKDGSAWNVLFRGTAPVFCDLLSFQRLRHRKWWAAGQFARHFIVPLLLSRQRGLHGYQAFTTWRDGVPPEAARGLLGPGRFLTRYWPLVAEGEVVPPAEVANGAPVDAAAVTAIARFRTGLQTSLGWMLGGVAPRTVAPGAGKGWAGYVDDRSHYDACSMQTTRKAVGEWLARVSPSWIADLGCNTGEFSIIALELGAEVVAIDADHGAVERLYRSRPGASRLHPLIATLDDMPNGRGWAGNEQAGLPQRLTQQFDLVMMLALVHHLAVAAAIPLDAVAAFAARCTRRWLIVELIDATDPQLCLLCAQRQRTPTEFSIESQRAAFHEAGFVVEAEVSLQPAARVLMLMRRCL